MTNINKKKRIKKEILFSNLLTIFVIALIAIGIVLAYKVFTEKRYSSEYNELVESYYDQQKIKSDYSMYDENSNEETTSVETSCGVDAILYVESLDLVLPVCSGNYMADIEAFRLTTLYPEMKLGKTTYSIMGHHAKMLNIAFGWLHKLEKGSPISLEKDGIMYNYYVDDIYVGYAAEMPEIFTVSDEDVVYMSTCDYSLGRSSKIVYRVVKCVRY